ncbi:MAG: polynucleotide adenylyltransferase PcnB, partial [Treponema sp.]|nr:polynucleotide adenylyltransferase PcnB [Treponema sp.]
QVKPVIPISEIFSEDPVRMIRAVKYAAATGFSLPLSLKLKISKQSNLLSSISHSRLTEEIFKIINSDKAAEIVNLLDKMGLYYYLQPNAASMMARNASFRQKYLQRMAELKGSENVRGQALGSLFYDYLETVSGWKAGSIENYKDVFKTARSFVLPMNPPRFEMEHALKKFLASHGITVKRSLFEKSKPVHESDELKSTAAKKRKRRRRKPSAPSTNPKDEVSEVL